MLILKQTTTSENANKCNILTVLQVRRIRLFWTTLNNNVLSIVEKNIILNHRLKNDNTTDYRKTKIIVQSEIIKI